MGSVISALLLAGFLLAWFEKPLSLFVGFTLLTISALSWFFYSDVTQPLALSF